MENNTTKPFYNTTIPNDWVVKELKDVCKKITDGTHDTPTQTETGVPFLTAIHVKEDLIDFDNCYFLPELTHREIYRRCNPEKNDVLMVNIGAGVATTALVNVDYEFSLKNVALLKPNIKHIIGSYLNHYQVFIKPRLTQSLLNGGAQPFLSLKQIQKLQVALPPLPEQHAIAHVLGLMDSAINQNNQLIAQKELRKKWLMQNLLTGKKRLKGFDEKWKEYHLGEMFKERNETKHFDLPLLSVGASGIYPQSDSIKKDTSNEDKSKYKRICPGDIGYNTMRMWQGRSALSGLEGIVSPAYTIVAPKRNADSLFFSYLFKMPKLTNLFWRNSQGLVDDTLNCKFKDFSIIKVHLPEKIEQIAIAQVLQAADKEIQLLKAKTEKLREQKKGMMQVLLTGKKRLKINT